MTDLPPLPLENQRLSELATRPPTDADGSTMVGAYRLLRPLGAGGMGEVWLAEQTSPVRRNVALKVIKTGMDSRQVVARFEAERQALALLEHPAIARVLDAGATAEGRLYFVMEYVRGESITDYVSRRQLPLTDRLEVFLQVCDGIQHAHQKGIIHRDLKPSNILVVEFDGHPQAKIIDFGLAKAMSQPLTAQTLFTEVGTIIGTLEYMSPEQADLSADVDTRSDVYSLGVLLYELMTGTLPFDFADLRAKGLDELRRVLREVDAPVPSERVARLSTVAEIHPADVRGDLDAITMHALEKERSRRYGSVAELAADVRRHLQDLPIVARTPGATYRTKKFIRRHRVGAAVATFVSVLVVAFLVTGVLQARRVVAERDRANTEASVAKAVTDFLTNDVLAQASPGAQAASQAPDPNLTVRTALDRAAASVDRTFVNQPVVEAAIRGTIGKAYADLGLFPEAEKQLKVAIELRKRVFGESHADTLTLMNILGDLYRQQARYAEAEPLLRAVVAVAQRSGASGELLDAMNNLAVVHRFRGDYEQAEALYLRVLEGERTADGGDSSRTISTLINLGNLYRLQKKLSQSEQMLREAARRSEAESGAEHPVTIAARNNLAQTLFAAGKLAEAVSTQEQVVVAAKRIFGERHPNTLTSMAALGDFYGLAGRYKDALPLLTDAVQTGIDVQGADHPNTLLSQHKLAVLYRRQGDRAKARELATRVVESSRRVLGPNHQQTLNAIDNLREIDRELVVKE